MKLFSWRKQKNQPFSPLIHKIRNGKFRIQQHAMHICMQEINKSITLQHTQWYTQSSQKHNNALEFKSKTLAMKNISSATSVPQHILHSHLFSFFSYALHNQHHINLICAMKMRMNMITHSLCDRWGRFKSRFYVNINKRIKTYKYATNSTAH